MRRQRLLSATLALSIAGAAACWGFQRETPDRHYTLYVFGTLVEIVVPESERRAAERILPAISAEFTVMHRDWHAWQPGEMTRLNAAFAAGESMTVSPLLAEAILQGQKLEAASGGLFNPAIGALIGLWGFHSDDLPIGPPPTDEAIETLVAAHPSMADIHIDGQEVYSNNPAVSLDFGGFAKGTALDWAAGTLQDAGVIDAVLNAGGDVNVIGRNGAKAWRVAIRDPSGWGAIASVELKPGEVLYTSGNYFRYREDAGIRYSHILDPRTGRPVGGVVSASVIAENGALADAAATALSVAGSEHWRETARLMGLSLVLLVDSDGAIHMTPEMRQRIRLEEDAGTTAIFIEDLNAPEAGKPDAPGSPTAIN
ncbi:FAD:protein FMN transferase [Martelella endophytica]|uniref:FAD:protein FMN transferase n=1 Tax=Martelella endophytica TaxID=1486262 RepID=UPI0005F152C4|nr:FAD:protein FMN transferase [Martelella endophytica]